jgi:hypothetical protein
MPVISTQNEVSTGSMVEPEDRVKVQGNQNSLFFFPVPVCAITTSGVPGGTLVSMNHFSTLCG